MTFVSLRYTWRAHSNEARQSQGSEMPFYASVKGHFIHHVAVNLPKPCRDAIMLKYFEVKSEFQLLVLSLPRCGDKSVQ